MKKKKLGAKGFMDLIDAIVAMYGLSEDEVIEDLKKAFATGYRNSVRQKDVLVKVEINKKKALINIYNQKLVVNEDEVEDDFLQISLEDAREINPKVKLGDLLDIKEDLDELNRNASNLVVKKFQELINEERRTKIFNTYKDKKGEMVVGEVEVVDPKLITIKLDDVSVEMPLQEQIPNEHLEVGTLVKVYIKEVPEDAKSNKSQIIVSRTNTGLLRRLFENEVTEFRDGIVEIRSIAREPGERAKVAVSSRNENVDAPGACIGPKGVRIQKITSQINNEKIDVIQYYDEPELYIAEALKPAEIYGLSMNKETKSCIAVVPNDEYSVAIGSRGINVRLAVKLTDWRIDIKTVDEALASGIAFKSLKDIKEEIKKNKEQAEIAEIQETTEKIDLDLTDDILGDLSEVAGEDSLESLDEVMAPISEEDEDKTLTTKKARGLDTLMSSDYIPTAERELEEAKQAEQEARTQAPRKKKEEKTEETKPTETKTTPNNYMPVYTDEELEALDAEEDEEETYDDDVDYDEFDKYYE